MHSKKANYRIDFQPYLTLQYTNCNIMLGTSTYSLSLSIFLLGFLPVNLRRFLFARIAPLNLQRCKRYTFTSKQQLLKNKGDCYAENKEYY